VNRQQQKQACGLAANETNRQSARRINIKSLPIFITLLFLGQILKNILGN
jgi:hypothetical protein